MAYLPNSLMTDRKGNRQGLTGPELLRRSDTNHIHSYISGQSGHRQFLLSWEGHWMWMDNNLTHVEPIFLFESFKKKIIILQQSQNLSHFNSTVGPSAVVSSASSAHRAERQRSLEPSPLGATQCENLPPWLTWSSLRSHGHPLKHPHILIPAGLNAPGCLTACAAHRAVSSASVALLLFSTLWSVVFLLRSALKTMPLYRQFSFSLAGSTNFSIF